MAQAQTIRFKSNHRGSALVLFILGIIFLSVGFAPIVGLSGTTGVTCTIAPAIGYIDVIPGQVGQITITCSGFSTATGAYVYVTFQAGNMANQVWSFQPQPAKISLVNGGFKQSFNAGYDPSCGWNCPLTIQIQDNGSPQRAYTLRFEVFDPYKYTFWIALYDCGANNIKNGIIGIQATHLTNQGIGPSYGTAQSIMQAGTPTAAATYINVPGGYYDVIYQNRVLSNILIDDNENYQVFELTACSGAAPTTTPSASSAASSFSSALGSHSVQIFAYQSGNGINIGGNGFEVQTQVQVEFSLMDGETCWSPQGACAGFTVTTDSTGAFYVAGVLIGTSAACGGQTYCPIYVKASDGFNQAVTSLYVIYPATSTTVFTSTYCVTVLGVPICNPFNGQTTSSIISSWTGVATWTSVSGQSATYTSGGSTWTSVSGQTSIWTSEGPPPPSCIPGGGGFINGVWIPGCTETTQLPPPPSCIPGGGAFYNGYWVPDCPTTTESLGSFTYSSFTPYSTISLPKNAGNVVVHVISACSSSTTTSAVTTFTFPPMAGLGFSGGGVSGVNVMLGVQGPYVTDQNGNVEFDNYPVGPATITVMDSSGNVVTSGVNVAAGVLTGATVVLPCVSTSMASSMTVSPYASINFIVTDITNDQPIKGANVTVANQTAITGTNGVATYVFLVSSYPTPLATITADGYQAASMIVTLQRGEALTIRVALVPILKCPCTIRVIVDDSFNGAPISGANVGISGYSNTTGTTGETSITVQNGPPPISWPLVVTANGYQSWQSQVAVGSAYSTIQVALVKPKQAPTGSPAPCNPCSITIAVIDANTGQPIPNAIVQVDTALIPQLTNTFGKTTFSNLASPPADHGVSVSASGYQSKIVTIIITNGSTYTVALTPASFCFIFCPTTTGQQTASVTTSTGVFGSGGGLQVSWEASMWLIIIGVICLLAALVLMVI